MKARARTQVVVLEDGEGEQFSLDEFLAANEEMEPEDLAAVQDLRVGELYAAGGGAWAEWSVTRIA